MPVNVHREVRDFDKLGMLRVNVLLYGWAGWCTQAHTHTHTHRRVRDFGVDKLGELEELRCPLQARLVKDRMRLAAAACQLDALARGNVQLLGEDLGLVAFDLAQHVLPRLGTNSPRREIGSPRRGFSRARPSDEARAAHAS